MAVKLDKNCISHLLDILKPAFPASHASLPIYGVLRNISLLESDTSQVWVDKWPIVGAVLICRSPGPGQIPAMMEERNLFAFKAENARELLKKAFVGRAPLQFAAADEEVFGCIKEAANNAGYWADIETGIVDMHYLTGTENMPTGPCLPPGFRIEPLRPSNAALLNADWPYSLGKVTESYFEKLIAMSISAGIFEEGSEDPAAFVICYEDCCIGNLHVKADFRRRGFATILMSHIIREVKAKGLIPHSYVVPGNVASTRLHEKFGFTKYERKKCWISCVFY